MWLRDSALVLTTIILAAGTVRAQPINQPVETTKEDLAASGKREEPNATDTDCSGVSPLSRFPFITIAEFAGRKNLSREYWRTAGGFTAHKENSIRICFDKKALAEDGRFAQGTISLAAKIGDRSIEVDGYSEVGKPQTLRSAAFRTDLEALIRSAGDVSRDRSPVTPRGASGPPGSADDPRADVESARNIILLADALVGTPQNARTLQRVLGTSLVIVNRHLARLREALSTYDQARKLEDQDEARLLPEYQKALAELMDAESQLREATDRHMAAKEERDAILDTEVDAALRRAELTERIRTLEEAVRASRLDVGVKDNALRRITSKIDDTMGQTSSRVREASNAVVTALQDLLRELRLRPSIKDYESELLRYAGGVDDAEIFLSKQDAQAGDILRLYLLHYRDATGGETEETATTAKPQQYTLAEIYIDDYGYHRSILDSFLLVKRLNEPDASSDESNSDGQNVSPSNFKGTGGVSLLWSKTARPHEARVWRVLGPSWGLNVSYLDFDTSKEIEIGAGVVAGFFDNQMHVGCGWNLNVNSNRNYCFVGFSFAAIEKKLAGKKEEVPSEPNE